VRSAKLADIIRATRADGSAKEDPLLQAACDLLEEFQDVFSNKLRSGTHGGLSDKMRTTISNRIKSGPRSNATMCFKCNKEGHRWDDCWVSDQIECFDCGKTGHLRKSKFCEGRNDSVKSSESKEKTDKYRRGRSQARDKRNKSYSRVKSKGRYSSRKTDGQRRDSSDESSSDQYDKDSEDDRKKHQSRVTQHFKVRVMTVTGEKTKADNNATPPLHCEVFQAGDAGKAVRVAVVPDTGSTKFIISCSLMKKKHLKYRRDDDMSLEDASGNAMAVEGVTVLFIRPEEVDGRYNKSGKAIKIEALVSSSMGNDDMFLSWSDMIRMGIM
jgi:hypothetical protein